MDDFTGVDVIVPDPDVVTVTVVDSDLSIAVDCTRRKPGVIRIPLHTWVKNQKVRLHVSRVDGLPYIGKFESTPSGEVIKSSFEDYNLEHQKSPTQYSLGDKYYDELSLWFGCWKISGVDTGVVYIDKIEIVPLKFTDDRGFVYLLAVILLVLVLAPGLLLYCLVFARRRDHCLLVWWTPLSLLALSVLYGALEAGQYWSPELDIRFLAAAYAALVLGLLTWLAAAGQLNVVAGRLASVKWEALAIFLVMLCVAAVVSENQELPLYTLTHGDMRYLTYGAFGAHDTMFQYVNGMAILNDEPFSQYYENYKLMYQVEDRGVYGGALYAVMRGVAAPFNPDVAYSYGYYTLFGSILNVLVLFPVFALHRYFRGGQRRPMLILFLMCASAFFITNFYLTWFKLAGAGLVLSGIVLLLMEPRSTWRWIAAGVFWGAAANFHPSLALSYPIVTIWLLYRMWRARDNRFLPVLFAFGGLMTAFVMVMLPWQLIKASHYEDTNRLFREHFLASEPYDQKRGLIGSVSNFVDRYTLAEQLSTRYDRLRRSLRIEEVKFLVKLAAAKNWQELRVRWNRVEAAYTFHVFTWLIVLLIVSLVLTRLFPATAWKGPAWSHAGDFRGLLVTQVLSILLIIVGSYGKNDPDLTWNMPMSSLVIVLYLLIHANISVGRIGLAAVSVYSVFSYYRLFSHYF